MKQFKLHHKRVIIENNDSIHNYFAWPTVTRLKNGRIAVVASGFRLGHVCPFGKAVMSVSEDEGKSFSFPTPVIDTTLDDRDAGIVSFGDASVIVTSFTHASKFQEHWCKMRESLAESENWSEERKAKQDLEIAYIRAYLRYTDLDGREEDYFGSNYRISHDNGITFGNLFRVPVTSPHGPCITPDGRILYIGTRKSTAETPIKDKNVECWELDGNGGATYVSTLPHTAEFEKYENLADYEEPHAIALPNGKIIVHIREQFIGKSPLTDGTKIFRILQSVSIDGGKSFSVPVPICEDANCGAPAHILRHSSGVLISAVSHRATPYGIYVLISRDDGETWELCSLVTDSPNSDLGYPSTVELSDGSLYTVWYDHESEEKTSPAKIFGGNWNLI